MSPQGRRALILALLTLPWLTACSRFAVSERIGEQARSGSVVDIAKATDFSWTEVRIYTPYSTRELVCNDLGELAPGCLHEAPGSVPEGEYLLVFIDQERAERYLPHHRRNGNFQSSTGVLTLKRDFAVLDVLPPKSEAQAGAIYLQARQKRQS